MPIVKSAFICGSLHYWRNRRKTGENSVVVEPSVIEKHDEKYKYK